LDRAPDLTNRPFDRPQREDTGMPRSDHNVSVTREELAQLAKFDTPTICNGLEVVVPERRGHGYTIEHLECANPALPPIVGFARTVTIRSVQPTARPADEMRTRRVEYYRYVANGPQPSIAVIQDLDPNPGYGAFWGEVQSNVHKGLGCLGCVTNGSFRDLDMLAPGFQILGGKIGPSHAFVHAVDFGGQVNIHGMTVKDGDLIHADRHGAVMIPAGVVPKLLEAIDLVARREKVILDAVRAPGFDIAMLEKALARSNEIH
jgi:regulator of RNase E activity RraA